ncbi:MAG: zinc-ribbon domain-containing protein [Candidatus Obscuribacter sp.]|nr:zinc-ribbon domain-containing protein [Candidatus Obscuribacter sp.]
MVSKHIEEILEPHPYNRRSPSVAKAHPELAQEWFYERNCGFGPEDFSYGSNVRVWWQCERDPEHIWKAQISQRCICNRDCPFCFGKYLRSTPVINERSLAVRAPELAKQWHKDKNGNLKPENVLAGSNRKIWWQCQNNPDHAWQANLKSRVDGRGCPLCYDDRLLDLADFPEIYKFFDGKKNPGVSPNRLTTTAVYWWRCPKGQDHSWQSRFRKKTLFCPYCRNRKVSKTNSLATLYPKVAQQLHPTKNGELTADKITAYSSKRVWWRCAYKPTHVWCTAVNNRTRLESGCPECHQMRRSSIGKRPTLNKR